MCVYCAVGCTIPRLALVLAATVRAHAQALFLQKKITVCCREAATATVNAVRGEVRCGWLGALPLTNSSSVGVAVSILVFGVVRVCGELLLYA